jgi:cell shape-determining protein MreC
MRMIYHPKNKNKKNNWFTILIILIIILFITIFADSLIRKGANNTTGNFWKIREYVFYPFNALITGFKSKKELEILNQNLNEENKKLKIENLTVQILKNENETLKNIIQKNQNLNSENLILKVLQSPPFSPYDKLIVARQNQEIFVGEKVYFGNLALGLVEEVNDKTILIKLLSSPDQKIQARINDTYNVEIEGRGNLSFIAFLPKDIDINKGDVVSLPDEHISVLGVVQEIKTTEASSFQEIYLHFPLEFSTIRFIEIKR